MSGDIFGCHNSRGAAGIWWVEAKVAAKHPTTHRTSVTANKNPMERGKHQGKGAVAQRIKGKTENHNNWNRAFMKDRFSVGHKPESQQDQAKEKQLRGVGCIFT